MNQLHKKLIFNLTESNYAEANKLLEQIAEQKVRDRISTSLKRVDEGLFDRLGARVSGLGAGLKAKAQNVATRVGSTGKAMVQNVKGAATGQGFSQGQATVDAANKQIAANDPAKRAKAAKADALIASFAKDLSILYPGINPQKLLGNLRTQLNLARPVPKPTPPPASNPAVKNAAPVTANP